MPAAIHMGKMGFQPSSSYDVNRTFCLYDKRRKFQATLRWKQKKKKKDQMNIYLVAAAAPVPVWSGPSAAQASPQGGGRGTLECLEQHQQLASWWAVSDSRVLEAEMDARDFIKVSVAGLGLRIPVTSKASRARIHSSASPCFCEIRLPGFPVQTAPVPLVCAPGLEPDPRLLAASFYLDHRALQKLVSPVSCIFGSSAPCLEIVLHTGPLGIACGVGEGKMIGVLSMPISSDWAPGATVQQQVVHAGWVKVGSVGKEKKAGGGDAAAAELHAIVRVESDPRYVFLFDGDIALSPQIVQVNGLGKGQQPVFSCKFSKDRLFRTRPGGQGDQTPSRAATGAFSDKESKERKGWLVTIHDLSGSPVAAASMVTPFVPFTGSDRVSRSNPGAWLILVPDPAEQNCCWRPWGRLEGWREPKGLMGLKFHLVSDSAGGGLFSGIHVCETMISRRGGEFAIDTGRSLLGSSQNQQQSAAAVSPAPTPQSSGDCSFYLGLAAPTAAEGGGFVMSCELQRGGSGSRRRGSGAAKKATVQLSTRHIGCVEDAAVFLALAAAVDLSRDACQPFSRKLRKELCQD